MFPRKRLLILALLLLGWQSLGRTGDKPEVRFEDALWAWPSRLARPVRLLVLKGRGGMLRTLMDNEGWRITHDASLPDASPVFFETTMYSWSHWGNSLSWAFAGQEGRHSFGSPGFSEEHVSGYSPFLTCVNGVLLREIDALDEDEKIEGLIARTLEAGLLPRRWQSYVGFAATLIIDAKTVSMLEREQCDALVRWVHWLGGRIWIVGENGQDAARFLGLRLPADMNDGHAPFRALNGIVCLQPDPDPRELGVFARPQGCFDPFDAFYRVHYRDFPTERLFASLDGVPTTFIVICLLVLGVILGPANYRYVRGRKNFLLFFLTTPLIAGAGAAVIIVGSIFVEGLDCRYNQSAVLIRNGSDSDSMLFDLRGVRSGFSVPVLRFPSEALALPITNSRRFGGVGMDLSDGLALTDGWLKPRFTTGYLVACPVVSRMRVEVENVNGEPYVVNGLGFSLEQVSVRLSEGEYAWAENVPPGGRTLLQKEKSAVRYRKLGEEYARIFGEREGFNNASLIAHVSGLPYLEDGGLGGKRLSGDFYYLEMENSGERAQP